MITSLKVKTDSRTVPQTEPSSVEPEARRLAPWFMMLMTPRTMLEGINERGEGLPSAQEDCWGYETEHML